MRRSAAFLLSLVLCLVLSVPVLAASYPDLDETHWAYADLERACALDVLSGMPDGTLQPSATLTWGQYLTMLGRSFYPGLCAAYGGAEGHWAMPYFLAAHETGVLRTGDFLPVTAETLDAPLLRRDAAALLARLLPDGAGSTAVPAFPDWDALSPAYQEAVAAVCSRGLVSGMPDGSFRGEAPLVRADGAVLLLRLMDLRGTGGEQAAPETQIPAQSAPEPVPAPAADPALRTLGENDAKRVRLFGEADKRRFASREEADAHVVKVTVPVWRLNASTGEKTSGSCTFTVHEALAEDITAIFTEIYGDPEQFPIKNIGGYRWVDGAKGEHNCATAVDVNWEENYQIYDSGKVGAGNYWKPGDDPFSIPENGSVVRIFASYGYSWGGNAWPGSKDYMHFSYMGV